MKKITLFISMVTFAMVMGIVLVKPTHAAGNKYIFLARGIITEFDEQNKTVTLDVTKVVGDGKEDMEGSNIEFRVNTAKIFRVVNKKDQRVTYHNLDVGQEIGIRGAAKDDDTFVLTFARIHDRSFTVIGLLQEHDQDAKTLEVQINSSTYKPQTYSKGDNLTLTYSDDSVFRENNEERSFDDVNADAQRVKVQGRVENHNTWKVKTLWNNYKGKN